MRSNRHTCLDYTCCSLCSSLFCDCSMMTHRLVEMSKKRCKACQKSKAKSWKDYGESVPFSYEEIMSGAYSSPRRYKKFQKKKMRMASPPQENLVVSTSILQFPTITTGTLDRIGGDDTPIKIPKKQNKLKTFLLWISTKLKNLIRRFA